MDICDKPLYIFTNIILISITLVAFFSCYYFATSDDDCNFNKKINKWLIFYGIYDLFFGINLMILNQIYNYKINPPKSFFNIHTMFIIIPNIIILTIMASMNDLNLNRNDCNYTKYYFYSCHWIFYSSINFIICYFGLMYNFIKMIVGRFINEVEIDSTPRIITIINEPEFNIDTIAENTNKIYECNICFENKKMYILKCKHTFCYDCIMKWHKHCMICRVSLIID